MENRRIVRQLRHGQITIPKEFRDAMALAPDDLLAVSLEDGRLEVEPVRVGSKGRGSGWLRQLYAEFAPVRRSLDGVQEAEVDAAIDEAVREVRRRRGK
ncbi:MAG TPA: AbrB/MazE/SpoVT family DNA-binding domain-containing protein [Dehalococcoidia bacterium]|jgi:AbrB family looped-hinge helix DNA binding protein|nr:AbrB/MazE/SpoVT family DNA-binding domain-containing protein [Dehalococcoidia bacterium]